MGGQGGCERRIEVFVKIQKTKLGGREGGGVWGVRVDVIEELKFLVKLTKKKFKGGRFGGVRLGVRVDVNEKLKFCENSKKNIYFFLFFFFFFFLGGGPGAGRVGGSGWM